jgi:ATP-dependent DNA helicase RecG
LGTCYYYNTAVLFFAKNLDKHFFHTCVTCALYKGLDKVTVLDRKDFNHDIIDNIDKAMIFLQQHLNVRYEFDGSPARKEIPEIPIEALREAVINAVIHRDYFEKGANVMVEIYDDRVEITNPGGLPKGLKVKDFGKISILRNPNIANLMQRIEYIEKMGTGIRRMQKMLAGAGLPPIDYEFSNFVRAVFFRPRAERAAFEVKDREADYYASTPQAPRKHPASTPQAPRKQKPEGPASILAFCAVPRSRAEIQAYLGLKDREHFRLNILQPLLKNGSLIPTIPDKPNSPRQKYLAARRK